MQCRNHWSSRDEVGSFVVLSSSLGVDLYLADGKNGCWLAGRCPCRLCTVYDVRYDLLIQTSLTTSRAQTNVVVRTPPSGPAKGLRHRPLGGWDWTWHNSFEFTRCIQELSVQFICLIHLFLGSRDAQSTTEVSQGCFLYVMRLEKGF